jgi:hypothetical protein
VQNLAVLPKLSSDILWPGIKPAEKYIRKTTKTSFQKMEQKINFIKIIFQQIPMKIKGLIVLTLELKAERFVCPLFLYFFIFSNRIEIFFITRKT